MIKRLSKISLVFIIAANLSIVSINNLLDYTSNYLFVKNVLNMNTTFPDNKLKYRAVTSPFLWNAIYILIIIWEFAIAYFCWMGIIKLLKSIKSSGPEFEKSKTNAIIGLTLCILLFGFIFITVAGEWFLMWQSTIWNGESAALKLFMMSGIALIYLNMKE
jgi:predicted small integral membrane protein